MARQSQSEKGWHLLGVFLFLNVICAMQIMFGIQPDTFTKALLNTKIGQWADIFWKLTVGKTF